MGMMSSCFTGSSCSFPRLAFFDSSLEEMSYLSLDTIEP